MLLQISKVSCSQASGGGGQMSQRRPFYLTGWSKSRRWHSHSRSLNHLQRHLPQPQSRHQSPSPSPPWSCPADKQLSCSLADLHLHPLPQASQSRVRRGDANMHTEGLPAPLQQPMQECTPKDWRKKQIRFDIGEDLGIDPTQPMQLTTFLAGGMAKE